MLPILLNCTIFNVIAHKKKKNYILLFIPFLLSYYFLITMEYWPSPVGSTVKKKKTIFNAENRTCRLNPWVRKIPWRKVWQPTLVFLHGESYRQKSLAATVYKIAKNQTWLKWLSMHALVWHTVVSTFKIYSIFWSFSSCPREVVSCQVSHFLLNSNNLFPRNSSNYTL